MLTNLMLVIGVYFGVCSLLYIVNSLGKSFILKKSKVNAGLAFIPYGSTYVLSYLACCSNLGLIHIFSSIVLHGFILYVLITKFLVGTLEIWIIAVLITICLVYLLTLFNVFKYVCDLYEINRVFAVVFTLMPPIAYIAIGLNKTMPTITYDDLKSIR